MDPEGANKLSEQGRRFLGSGPAATYILAVIGAVLLVVLMMAAVKFTDKGGPGDVHGLGVPTLQLIAYETV